MKVSRYGKELAEMMELWNCASEREAAQIYLQAVYIDRGNRPAATADFIGTLPDEEISRGFVAMMDINRRGTNEIDLLPLKSTR